MTTYRVRTFPGISGERRAVVVAVIPAESRRSAIAKFRQTRTDPVTFSGVNPTHVIDEVADDYRVPANNGFPWKDMR